MSVQGVSPPSTAEGEEEGKENEGPGCGELGASPPSTTQGEGDGKAEEEPACGELGALLPRGVGIYSLLSAIRETFSNCLGESPWSLRISK